MEDINLGMTLKNLRKSKGFKTKYLIENIMSESHYYKVESGDTNITAILLINLLDRMNISPNEFWELMNCNYSKKRGRFTQITNMNNHHDFFLKHLSDLQLLKKGLLNSKERELISNTVKAFLFEKDEFFKYEFSIFVNYICILDPCTVSIFNYKAINYGKVNATDVQGIDDYFHLLCNLFYFYYTNQDQINMEKYLDILTTEQKIHQDKISFRHISFITYYQYVSDSFSNQGNAFKKIQTLLLKIKELGFIPLFETLNQDFKELKELQANDKTNL